MAVRISNLPDGDPAEQGDLVPVTRPSDSTSYHVRLGLTNGQIPLAGQDFGTGIGQLIQVEDVGGEPKLPEVDGSQLTALKAAWPVGSIYINANDNTNPSTLLGFGTWSAFGSGRVLLGQGGGYTAGETGGTEEVALTTAQLPAHAHEGGDLVADESGAHTHNVSGNTNNTGNHSHNGNTNSTGNHSHTYFGSGGNKNNAGGGGGVETPNASGNRSTESAGLHSHNVATNSSGAHSHNVSGNAASAGDHTHTVSGTSAETGGGEGHPNMQPYVVVYMWMRTA